MFRNALLEIRASDHLQGILRYIKLTFMAGARFSVRDKTDSHKSVKGSYSKKSLISKHCKAQVSSIENLLKDSFCILGNANALMISSCSFN